MQNTFYLLTFGCPKNEVVSENLGKIFLERNMKQNMNPETADFLIVNTCGFIQSAVAENLETIERLAKVKKQGGSLIVFGCLAQRYGNLSTKGKVDFWVKDLTELEDFLGRHGYQSQEKLKKRLNNNLPYAYVKIAEGCNNNCAFCTIPSFKGKYQSKPVKEILAEIQVLMSYGIQEIILIAQETTFYGRDLPEKTSLSSLLRKIIAKFPELMRIRIMYAHPQGINKELIEVIAKNKQIVKYLDIPLQHANDEILKAMNRPYTKEQIEKLIIALRRKIPEISLRSTFIVGYPGETEKEFEELKEFLKKVELDHAGFFAFEKEEGTKAAELLNQILDKIKQKRLKEIYKIQEEISKKKFAKLIGKTIEIIQEFEDREFTFGRAYWQAPEIDGYVKFKGKGTGKTIKVKIEKLEYPNLIGKLIKET